MVGYSPEERRYEETGGYLELPLLKILQLTSPYTGDDFLDSITGRLVEVCGVSLAYVSELLPAVERARIVAAWRGEERVAPFEYTLQGTPCAEALEQGSAVLRDSVEPMAPFEAWLPDLVARAYGATLLRSTSGDVIGVLAVVNDAPLRDADFVASLLEAVAPRVGAELERRQRDIALKRNEAKLRHLVENCRDILFYYREPDRAQGIDRRFEFISPAVEEITGYPPEAFQANPELALQVVYDEDRPLVRGALDSGSEEPITVRIRTAEGETRWIEYRNHAFRNADGKITAVSGTIRDMTRRTVAFEALQSGEQYRSALLVAFPDTLFRLDADGKMLDDVSGEATRSFGRQDFAGRNIKELLPSVFVAPITQVTQAALQTNRLQRTEFDVGSNSQTITYEARCLPFGSNEVLLILRDFTALKWHGGAEQRRPLRDEPDVKIERPRANLYMLTFREVSILHLISEGQADKQIAESLGISTYTVNKHVGNILGKMNAASRTEAGVRAIREGLVG